MNTVNNNDPRTHAIIGASMEVHRIIGSGHLEAVYQECLEIELELKGIQYISKPKLDIYYKDIKLRKYYIPDFIAYNEVVVEIKAERALTKEDEAQIKYTQKISLCQFFAKSFFYNLFYILDLWHPFWVYP